MDVLRLERDLFVPAELVFEAWSQTDHLSGWYPEQSQRVEPDSAPGAFQLVDAADGPLETVSVLASKAPAMLRWSLTRAAETGTVEVAFTGSGGTCRISFEERGFGATGLERRRSIWEGRLDRLESYFSAI